MSASNLGVVNKRHRPRCRRQLFMTGLVNIAKVKCSKPFPTFFVSHGSPSLIDINDPMTDKGAFRMLQTLGKKIRELEPDYLLMVSAHHQASEPGTIEISVGNEETHENSLIYDFYGFPEKLYHTKFKSKSNLLISLMLYDNLKKAGFKAKVVNRGLDHGIWCPSHVMFGEELSIPLIQVSLPNDEDFGNSYKLGEVLKFFRNNLIWDPQNSTDLKGLIIASGSSVHNLGGLRKWFMGGENARSPSYVGEFHDLIKTTVEKSTPLTLLQNFNNWKKDSNFRQLLYQAHPTLDHFLPFIVAAGTQDDNKFHELYRGEVGSIGYGFYQFGDDHK